MNRGFSTRSWFTTIAGAICKQISRCGLAEAFWLTYAVLTACVCDLSLFSVLVGLATAITVLPCLHAATAVQVKTAA